VRTCLAVVASLLAASAALAGEAAAPDANPALDKRPLLSGAPVIVGRSRFYKWENVVTGAAGLATGFAVHPKDAGVMYVRTAGSGVFRREFNQRKWTPLCDSFTLADKGLYSVESIALDASDPNVIYMAAGRPGETCDILKSTDRGGNWKRLKVKNAKGEPLAMDGKGAWEAERLAIDPLNAKVVYFGSRKEGLLRSADGGDKWAPVESFPNPGKEGAGIPFVVFDGQRMYGSEGAAVIYAGVWGDWKEANRPPGVYRTKNAGETWEKLEGGPPADAALPGGAVGPDGTFYLATSKGLWQFRKERWEDISPVRECGLLGVTADPRVPGHLACHAAQRLYLTRDGGRTWAEFCTEKHTLEPKAPFRKPPWLTQGMVSQTLDMGIMALAFDPQDSKKLWCGGFAGVYSCPDVTKDSLEWALEYEGFEAGDFVWAIGPPTGAPLISGARIVGGFRHESLAEPPKKPLDESEGEFGVGEYITGLDFCESQPNVIAHVGEDVAGISDDAGRTWKPFSATPERAMCGTLALAPNDPQNVVWRFGGKTARPHWTRDGGKTWSPAAGTPLSGNGPQPGGCPALALASDRAKPHTFYIYDARDGRFYRSEDGGENWKHVATLPKQPEPGKASRVIAAAPGVPGEVWVALDEQGLFRSKDGGDSWQSVNGVGRAHALAFGKGPASLKVPALYLMGQIAAGDKEQEGVFRSYDLGRTWARITSDNRGFGLATGLVGDRQVVGRVYVLTSGRGISYGVPDVKKQAEEDAKWEKENGEKLPRDPE